MMNALLISTNERRPNVSYNRVYVPGFGFLNNRVGQHQVHGSEYGKSAEGQIGAKDVIDVCQHYRFSVNYA